MKNSPYFNQVRLILRILPYLKAEKRFALKGGTAINLFVREMPRLSIDIDLAWLPLEPRETALQGINAALINLANMIRTKIPGTNIRESRLGKTKNVVRLTVATEQAVIKIEPNLVIRGTVFPCEERSLCHTAEETFELTTTAVTVSKEDLYGGKLCAALDRQHPRDLFDIKVLMENEGITEKIRTAFVLYLASHDRPMSELLDPHQKDLSLIYKQEFAGMSVQPIEYKELVKARQQIIDTLRNTLTKEERLFLLSIKKGQPEWELLAVAGIHQLPAIQWKLFNIQKMDTIKHRKATEKLRNLLEL